MTVEIKKVLRPKGRALRMTALVGNMKITYEWPEGSEKPLEAYRCIYDKQVLMDRESLYISDADFDQLQRKMYGIFKEVRPSKKRTKKVSEKRNQEFLQEKLF